MTATVALAQQQALTTGGWVVMVGCIGLVCGLCAFCFYRILRGPHPSGADSESLGSGMDE